MTFRELPEHAQDFMIDMFEHLIETAASYHDVNDYKFPTYDEYADFFDEYEEDMELDEDGYAQSTVEDEYHNGYCISFDENNKAILEVRPPYDYED